MCMCVGRREGTHSKSLLVCMCVGGGGRGPTVHHSASVYVCGEEGGDPQYVKVLVSMCVGRREGTRSTSQC